jgi:hypothetical protein
VIRKLEATIERLDAQNSKTQRLVITLTYIAIAVGVLQAALALIPL